MISPEDFEDCTYATISAIISCVEPEEVTNDDKMAVELGKINADAWDAMSYTEQRNLVSLKLKQMGYSEVNHAP